MIELVTSLLAQDKVSPEQAASILQQMLPPSALSSLQAHLNTPRSSLDDAAGAPRPQAYRCCARGCTFGPGPGWAGLAGRLCTCGEPVVLHPSRFRCPTLALVHVSP